MPENVSGFTEKYLVRAAKLLEDCEGPEDLPEITKETLERVYERARIDGSIDREDLLVSIVLEVDSFVGFFGVDMAAEEERKGPEGEKDSDE